MVFIDVGLALLHPLLETAPILLQVRALQKRMGDEVVEPGGTAELPRAEGPGTPWAQWAGLQNKKKNGSLNGHILWLAPPPGA